QSGSTILTRTILYHRSRDNGRTWEPVRYLATDVFATIGNLVGNGSDLAFSISTANGPAVVRSADGGTTWLAPVLLSTRATPLVAANLRFAAGVLLACWSEQSNGVGDVFVARSLDAGATWGPELQL